MSRNKPGKSGRGKNRGKKKIKSRTNEISSSSVLLDVNSEWEMVIGKPGKVSRSKIMLPWGSGKEQRK